MVCSQSAPLKQTRPGGYEGRKDLKIMWKEGSIKAESTIYHYQAKVYDAPSQYGINQGRISKLQVQSEGQTVINYDRGWDKEPSTQAEKAVLYIILNSYN